MSGAIAMKRSVPDPEAPAADPRRVLAAQIRKVVWHLSDDPTKAPYSGGWRARLRAAAVLAPAYLRFLRYCAWSGGRLSATEVNLPFNCAPPMAAYLDSALPCGIVTRGDSLDGPALNHVVQTIFPGRKLTRDGRYTANVRLLPTLKTGHFSALGYLNTTDLSGTIARSGWQPRAFIADTLAALAAGRFVFTFVDEFFARGSTCYLRRNFRHACLIVGASVRHREFTIAGYGADGTFATRTVPFGVFAAGVWSGRYRGATPTPVTIHHLWPEAQPPTRLDPPLIRAQLIEYLSGKVDPDKYLRGVFSVPGYPAGPALPDHSNAYGHAMYHFFRRYLEGLVAERQPIDLRATRLLLEHKQLLERALRRCVGQDRSPIDVSLFAPLAGTAQQLHLASLAFNTSLNATDGERVLSLLATLADREYSVLHLILRQWRG